MVGNWGGSQQAARESELRQWRCQMTNEKNKNDEGIKDKNSDKYYFEVWKNYEKVAMHFNDLIVRLRIQSIGGLAALAAILGIFLHTQSGNDKSFNCGLATLAIICLILLWVAIWILDMRYYNRLLEGSVNAILELEKNKKEFLTKKQIDLSSNIESAFHKRFAHEPKGCRILFNGRNGFYLVVLATLFVILGVTGSMYVRGGKEKEIAPVVSQKIQNVCEDKQ